jgi:hypothetical protein
MPKSASANQIVLTELVQRRIYMLRGHQVMLDSELAELYQVEVRVLVQAVKRSLDRFPGDFMFQLTNKEQQFLRSQTVILKKAGRGQHRKYLPYAFTEQGVAMLSSVLKSKRAIIVNITVMRTFVKLRALLATHRELARKLESLERKYDTRFKVVFDAIRALMNPPQKPKQKIGFQ